MANLDWYKIFLEVAECKNITRASENLYISQPAVTKCIKLLEKDLGVQLFKRTHSGVELTEYGRAIYSDAKSSISKLDGLQKVVDEIKSGTKGELKIATTTSNAGQLLAGQIESFCKTNKEIELRIIRIGEDSIEQALDSFDYIFCDKEFAPKSSIPVFDYEVKYNFIASANSKIENIDESTINNYNFVLINKTYTSRTNIDNFFRGQGISLHSKYEVDNYATAVKLVKNGLGIGIVNPDYFEKEINSGEIKVVPSSISISPRHLSLIKSTSKNQTTASKMFENLFNK